MKPFSLHNQLMADTVALGDLPLCRVLLMNDKRFPWLILVPMKDGLKDLTDLLPGEQAVAMQEINRAGLALKEFSKAPKLNIAALGNMVPQLHIHIIARFENDAAWPKPVWGVGQAEKYSEAELQKTLSALRGLMPLQP